MYVKNAHKEINLVITNFYFLVSVYSRSFNPLLVLHDKRYAVVRLMYLALTVVYY